MSIKCCTKQKKKKVSIKRERMIREKIKRTNFQEEVANMNMKRIIGKKKNNENSVLARDGKRGVGTNIQWCAAPPLNGVPSPYTGADRSLGDLLPPIIKFRI